MMDALELDLGEWESWCVEHNLPHYVALQIYQWIFQKNSLNPSCFTNLSLAVREKLASFLQWELLSVDSHMFSADKSEKFLLKTRDNLLIEMVLMPYDKRVTLCISSQVGCKMGCTFCQTGKMGFKRDLSAGEILAQIHFANACLQQSKGEKKVTNVVFMGMGEPLDNYEAVVKACRTMIDPKGMGLSKSRITISTSGLVPQIRRLSQDLPVRLAISLHAASGEKRSKMMPINRKYSLQELKKALLNYPAPPRYGITFEYILIEGVNDSIQDAKELVKYLHGLKAKVNLIPVNHFPGLEMKPSVEEKIRAFQSYLSTRCIPAPIRYSRGQDISGGCGQLAAKRKEETHYDPRTVHRKRREGFQDLKGYNDSSQVLPQ